MTHIRPLIKDGQLSVTGERVHTENRPQGYKTFVMLNSNEHGRLNSSLNLNAEI